LADFVAEVGARNGEVASSIYWNSLFTAALDRAVRHLLVDTDISIA
jgi:hypothetical protein